MPRKEDYLTINDLDELSGKIYAVATVLAFMLNGADKETAIKHLLEEPPPPVFEDKERQERFSVEWAEMLDLILSKDDWF